MEKIHALSKVAVPPLLFPRTVQETSIGVKDHFESNIPLLTDCSSAQTSRNFEFQIMPVLSSELDLRQCELYCKVQVLKNGIPCTTADQPSLVNYPGRMMFESSKVSYRFRNVI